MELTPDKIHQQYKDNSLDKLSASKLLFSIIETSENDKIRIESINKLGELEINDDYTFKFLENLLISDSNDSVRNIAAVILKKLFNNKLLSVMKWALIHEESPLCLTTIYITIIEIIEKFVNNNDSISKSILLKEVRSIKRKEFKLGFEILSETRNFDDFTQKELADILINFFTIEILEKTFWRLKYRIEKCKIVELDFIFKGLTSLPEPIKYLSSLKTLGLRYNQIISLPSWFSSQLSLEILNLNVNNLNDLPESIGSLLSLKELFLWKNELRYLPYTINNLSNLEKLNVRLNHLEKLPKSIGKLSALKELDLHDNHLSEIPNSINHLRTLEKLDLSWNNLTTLPNSIGGLASLKILNLEKNELKTIPKTLGSLSCLEILNLSENNLEIIPDLFKNLISLKFLNLSRNELSSIPKSIRFLPSLEELHLNENHLYNIPKWLNNLDDNGIKAFF